MPETLTPTPEIIEVVATAANKGIWDYVLSATLTVQLVLLLLVAMSVACWAIMIIKAWQLNKAGKQSARFLDVFWEVRNLDEIYKRTRAMSDAPVAQVFAAGYNELDRFRKSGGDPRRALETVQRALGQAMRQEVSRIERSVPFLATTGNTAPFIGLFGTVWGIMRTFIDLERMTGTATLKTVGPGIAEALIATAIGLFAAIPAVVAYNYFVNRIRVMEIELENFVAEFLNIMENHILKA
ncbi:MAG: protein TolQ [Candidatus Alcyoniella australis]|nr:protein TolQ [Candidatus Alcyoniella australis]